ncbi:MAG: hypothetical protein FJX52_16695 [Alphaproteobacteria bacterium]|nr:hypothetical protein [Alphaproteobacteria bacterium]
MSWHDFTTSEFARRQARVRAAMDKAGIDWLVATSPVSINYLIGNRTKAYLGFQCLYLPA